jgi:hypothetical protein
MVNAFGLKVARRQVSHGATVTGRGPAQGHQWRCRSSLQSRTSRAIPIQCHLPHHAGTRSSAHRHNYNVQGFHSASLRCSFWPNWAFNATVVCCRQNRASTCGALTSVLDRKGNSMNVKALLFAIAGAVVAIFYALESFLLYKATGFSALLLVKCLICGVGAYFFWRNVTRMKKSKTHTSSDGAV